MPNPKKGEKLADFLNRCIPEVIRDGTTDNPTQAAAICRSIYKRGGVKGK